MPRILTFEARDSITIRDGILRVIRNGLIARGVTNPNITPGSDWFVFATGVANELAVVEANAIVKADEQMPDSADGAALYRISDIYGLALQAAAGSVGSGILSSSTATTIATGQQLIDSAGLRYQITVGGTYNNGDSFPIAAVDVGSGTNHLAGDVLRWQAAPPFSDEKVLVATGGLINGHDAENDEGLRARLLARFRNPPASGNWAHVASIAEASSTNVEKAFVFPAIQGPSTLHVAVTSAATALIKTRDVSTAVMTGTVIPSVQGQLPEHAFIVTTTVANVPAAVSFSLSLPDATTASPPGPGGGWVDGAPWPDAGVTSQGTRITVVTSSSAFTVDATASPIAGVSHVQWINRTTWTIISARVLTVTGSSGAYAVTLDQPLVGAIVGDFIFPASVNAPAYLNAVFLAFAAMGPGEKSTNASALVRGFRRPRPSSAWPYSLGPQMTRRLEISGSEVLSAQFLYRGDGTLSITGPGGQLTPQVPGAVTSPPNIYVPGNLGFFRAT